MKKESWQGVKGSLVYEDDKAIIVDNSEDLKDIKKLSNQISENGKPTNEVRRNLKKNSIKRNVKTDIRDILTGYRGFSFRFVKTFPVLSRGFEIETEMSIHATEKRMLVENQVITYRDRPEGSESKLDTYGDGIRVLKTVVNLYRGYHPFGFYSIFSVTSLVVAALMFAFRVWIPYTNTHIVDNMPSLVVSMILVVLGVIAFFSGSILNAIQTNDKRAFELAVIAADERFRDLNK